MSLWMDSPFYHYWTLSLGTISTVYAIYLGITLALYGLLTHYFDANFAFR